MDKRLSSNFFIVLLLVLVYLAGLVVWPYISYLIIAVVLAYALHPLHGLLAKRLEGRRWLASLLMVFGVAIVLLLPASFLLQSLVRQGTSTLSNINVESITPLTDYFAERFHVTIDPTYTVNVVTGKVRDFLISETLHVIGSVADIIIGLIIMFFTLFYLFRDGKRVYRTIVDVLPLRQEYKEVLFGEMQLVTNAVIYGQLLTAIVQGILGGLGFAIFGIPNAVFWGFIMAILSFLPVVGTPLVFIPAGIFEIMAQDYVSGVGILVYGGVFVMNIDNFVKPLIISEKSRLNAAIILIGVIGGLKAFGFVGFIIGPLVLALLLAFLQVYRQDFKPSAELEEARKRADDSMVIRLHERPPDEHRQDDEDERLFRPRKRRRGKK